MPMNGFPTLYDLAASVGVGDGANAKANQKIIELQAQTNDIFQVLPLKECNDGTKEKVVLRTSLPEVAWRMLNKGVKPSKSAAGEISFTTGGVEAIADIDERQMQLNGNSNEYRMRENSGHQEAMTQKMCQTLFYGDEKINPAGFTGLGAYYYSFTQQDDIYKNQIVNAGGTGHKLTSLWIVTFGLDTIHGIYPKGVPAGYRYRDNGRVRVGDESGGSFWAYESQYNWDLGLAVRDPRYAVRLANIDTTQRDDTTFIAKLIDAMGRIQDPYKANTKTVILCNRDVRTYLRILASEKKNVMLNFADFMGKKLTHLDDAPIIRNDAIMTTEEQLV